MFTYNIADRIRHSGTARRQIETAPPPATPVYYRTIESHCFIIIIVNPYSHCITSHRSEIFLNFYYKTTYLKLTSVFPKLYYMLILIFRFQNGGNRYGAGQIQGWKISINGVFSNSRKWGLLQDRFFYALFWILFLLQVSIYTIRLFIAGKGKCSKSGLRR